MLMEKFKKEDESKYTKKEALFQDGEWWYVQPGDGNRRRITSHARKNTTRMFINGKYIPKSHPLHKPGRYKSLDDAWSHSKIESTELGEVYIIVNDAWPEWVKVGKAVSSEDRLNGYQTSSPFRDYSVIATLTAEDRHVKEREMHKAFAHFADERRGEWFKIDRLKAINIFNVHAMNELSKELQNEKTNATGS